MAAPRRCRCNRTRHSISNGKNGSWAAGLTKRTRVKYSPIQTLDYLSPVKDTVIDPMHNLFLGVAKTTLQTWKEKKLLTDGQCRTIQATVNSVSALRDIGRIPAKVAYSFSSLTADEWWLWTLLYSYIALEEVLPQEHYFCWDQFVRACTVFCSKVITGRFWQRMHGIILHDVSGPVRKGCMCSGHAF